MIILKLGGGLGNQLFQYAFARQLQEEYNEKIIFEVYNYKKIKLRDFSLNNFCLNDNVGISTGIKELYYRDYSKLMRIINEKIIKIRFNDEEGFQKMCRKGIFTTNEPSKYLHAVHTNKKMKYIRGFFQSPKYFFDIRDELIKEFVVKTQPNKQNSDMILNIISSNSVCVHIRRGDYIGHPLYDLCDIEYYTKAIELMAEKVLNPIFYIFSNSHSDLEFIKKVYKIEYPVIYVDLENPDYEELRLMYNCKHFIISNSTFSWWGQYLSSNPEKIVIAPDKWCKDKKIDFSDIYQSNWITLSV